jgi:hypothetical protein
MKCVENSEEIGHVFQKLKGAPHTQTQTGWQSHKLIIIKKSWTKEPRTVPAVYNVTFTIFVSARFVSYIVAK